jgi:hypothetical protein
MRTVDFARERRAEIARKRDNHERDLDETRRIARAQHCGGVMIADEMELVGLAEGCGATQG